ncbi:hypothetical protein LT679_04485 [Mucilaginibacter roseus]|uniref:DUF4397 domain-containing protein n=1 Tax=Mucilaginibacter roseus TaxID=1528868 RepID=A0ABS8U194_9SPHI|nr:hypothetical protein [Mucilaginibacter roseus]MCD8739850.1 hypothetical protein [Mucilaginibacter roseus]
MKNLRQIFSLIIITVFLFNACQKGKELENPAFGSLKIISSFTGDADPLLIQVDGRTLDTLTSVKQSINGLRLKEGERHLVFINQRNSKVITDTIINIERQKNFELPTFLYTGTGTLFDDLVEKPQPDSMLVRIVSIDPALPEIMNIQISLYDFAGNQYQLPNKSINGVRKDKFSNFIQLPNPIQLLPPGTDPSSFYYFIEGFDPANGNKKVMSIEEGNGCYVIDLDSFAAYTPNLVLSLGIGAPTEFSTLRDPSNIFRRVAQQ